MLHRLLQPVAEDIRATHGPSADAVAVSGIAYDSRRVNAGNLFVAVPGFQTDGHRYIESALKAGASACVIEREDAIPAQCDGVPFIRVGNARRALALCSAAMYDWPGRALTMVGVTGTNGKTTTTFLIEAMLADVGRNPGLIGTIQTRIGGTVRDAHNTTPESLDLQQLLAEMREVGHDSVVMEVSSHALVLDRVAGCNFRVAVFTNLTQDHLDFHGDMESYRAAKQLLFSGLDADAWAVVNADEAVSETFGRSTLGHVLTYGITAAADVRASNIVHHSDGTRFELSCPHGRAAVRMQLAGQFNVYNALAASAAAMALDVPLAAIVESLERIPPVRGRFETVRAGQPFRVVVDYAHTPDGLDNVLRAARAITSGRLIVVFGCGGDRDRTKRPKMGAIAAALADEVFVTSDNPRSEEPPAIIDEILRGIGADARPHVQVDRRAAIGEALGAARSGDCVVVAGKGHETYQILKNETIHFDDVEVVKDLLANSEGRPASVRE